MKILIDMNLSPEWAPVLAAEGWVANRAELLNGAIVTLDFSRSKVRILPIR